MAKATVTRAKSKTTKPTTPRPSKPLPNVWQLAHSMATQLWRYKRPFVLISLVYGLLNLIFVQSLVVNQNLDNLKAQFDQATATGSSSLSAGLSFFGNLLGNGNSNNSGAAGAYQFFIVVISSLAIIWALRQTAAGTAIRSRDAFYRGMYPLVPFILVLLVIGVELLPLFLGGGLFSLAVTNGVAITAVEQLSFGLVALALAAVTVFLVSSSIFSLYIVTLPDMTPLAALRSGRDLVRHRRWAVLRKLLFLPLLVLIGMAIILVPVIIWLTPLVQAVFIVLTAVALAVAHGYTYNLYRGLLHD